MVSINSAIDVIPVPVANGGTGVATLTNHGVLVGAGTSNVTQLAAGSAGQALLSGGASADPAYSTATYPLTTTAGQLLYSSATNTVGGLTSANNGVLSTGTTGTPVITALGQGQTLVGQGASSAPAATTFSNSQITYVPKFNSIPIMSLSTGGTAVVTINNTNLWSFPQWGAYFEAYNTVALQQIAPALSTTAGRGLNLDAATSANAAAIEITEGNSGSSKNAFVIGTSPAFYVKATMLVATLADISDFWVGFRKVQTYNATPTATSTGYSDYATIGVHSTAGEIEFNSQTAGGGNTITDSTQAISAATAFVLEMDVSAGGVCTFKLNGSAASGLSYTFTNALTVIPFIYYKAAAGAHAETDLVSYSCGFQ